MTRRAHGEAMSWTKDLEEQLPGGEEHRAHGERDGEAASAALLAQHKAEEARGSEVVDPYGASRQAMPRPSEQVSSLNASLFVLGWLINNIGVTLLNKAAFQFVKFPYPYTLSAVHMACNTIGTLVYFGVFSEERKKRKNLGIDGQRRILAFSLIFAANIAIGNASLKYVSVNFNQVMRSLVPGVVMVIGSQFFGKSHSADRKRTLVPVIIGVMLACFGEMHFSYLGFFVTCFCVLLAAAKVVLSNVMLTGEFKLGPLDLLSRMCPLAFVEIITVAFLNGELAALAADWPELSQSKAIPVVLISGIASFTLNITSFYANKMTSALTLSVAANAKQVLMIVIATIVFGTPMNAVNGVGTMIVLAGSAWYSQVSLAESNASEPGKQRG
uniref:Sugar phosphate transporter domain-containing protein n=1 Tax=Rhizochromulina marina TaxID=1034831 RepID=A0A7S2SVZ2_9STRA|mmetsp:Transcript_8860/g.25260  ORF Transcript_8860/g.25260 Transcript_8860/m.25260 type:complete len:386 (+) Transcript_8860:49-1206(+)